MPTFPKSDWQDRRRVFIISLIGGLATVAAALLGFSVAYNGSAGYPDPQTSTSSAILELTPSGSPSTADGQESELDESEPTAGINALVGFGVTISVLAAALSLARPFVFASLERSGRHQ